MKTLRVALIIALTFTSIHFSQTIYYVSSSSGSDSNSGTSESSPWQSLEKVNSTEFVPGDRILFKRGDMWRGSITVRNSGTQSNRIVFGSYGNGARPVIALFNKITEASNPTNWILYSQNIWRCQVSGVDEETVRLFRDSNYVEFGARATELSRLDNIDNWFYSSGYLYVYSEINPAGTYYTAWQIGTPYTVKLVSVNFITFQDLDIRGGYQCFYIRQSNNIYITDSKIGMGANGYGIIAHYSDYGIISNSIIDSYWRVRQNHNEEPSTSQSNGITLAGSNYWEIYNNQIIDWHHSGISIQGYFRTENPYASNYNKIFDNYFTARDIVYGRAFEVFAEGGQLGYASYNHFFRNRINNCPTRTQIGGDNNYVYFNIFDSTLIQPGRDYSIADAFRVEGSGFSPVNKKNYIFNNTIFHADGYGIWITNNEHFVANNLIVNAHQYFLLNNVYSPQYNGWLMLNVNYGSKNVIKNNLLFSSQTNSSSNIFYYWGEGKTLTQFNALNGTNNNVILNNKQYLGSQQNLINNNYTLPTGSPAIGAGIDITSLIPEGFVDLMGNIVNRANPDIGAIQKVSVTDITPPRLIAAALIDSTTLVLNFSEPLSPAGLSTTSNYLISNGILVYSVNSNQTSITLYTSPHLYGQNYNVSVFNIKDLAGNIIDSSNNSLQYQCNFNPPTGLSKLLIIDAIASDTDDVNLPPSKTIDGLYLSNGGYPSSRWAAMPTPQWLLYDLGTIKLVSKVKIAFYEFENGRIYNYNVFISKDKINWINVVSNALSSSQEWTEKSFDPAMGRYVKIEMISNNQNTWATVWEVEIWGSDSTYSVSASAKVFLQGSYYAEDQMLPTLNDLSQLPLQQPYNMSPFNYFGNESVSTIPSGVVDWILVELRSDTSAESTVSRRAAFIRTDGKIVDLDGISSVIFNEINYGDYYMVIRHRNHLSIMSANKIPLSDNSPLYDFTQSTSSAYGNDLASLDNNKYGMYAGDGDANGVINILDYSSVGNNLFQVGYKMGDLDMNGIINILDYGKTNQNLLKTSKVPGITAF